MTVSEAVSWLRGTRCYACSLPKERKHAFCRPCYARLPVRMRQALWRRVGQGFEAAYAEAREFLRAA